MEKKNLIGFWGNNSLEIELNHRGAKLYWILSDKSASGIWKIEKDILKIPYEFKGIKQLTNEFKMNGSKYDKELVLKIISCQYQNLRLLNLRDNQVINLKKNPNRTRVIYAKEEKKEDILQAYVTVLIISALVGPIIRWLINPDIPTWIIIVVIFFISLFLIRRNK